MGIKGSTVSLVNMLKAGSSNRKYSIFNTDSDRLLTLPANKKSEYSF